MNTTDCLQLMSQFRNPMSVYMMARGESSGELADRMRELNERAQVIQATADGENRELSSFEQGEIAGIFAEFDDVQRRQQIAAQTEMLAQPQARLSEPVDPSSNSGYFHGGSPVEAYNAQRKNRHAASWETGGFNGLPPHVREVFGLNAETNTKQKVKIFGPGAPKDYVSLYGQPQSKYPVEEWLQAAVSGRYHPAIYNDMTEGVGTDGGMATSPYFEKELWDISLEDEIVFPRANVIVMPSNTVIIPAYQIGNHSENLFGGILVYFAAEAGELQKTQPELRQVTLRAEKMYAYCRWSSELNEDGALLVNDLSNKFGQAIGFNRDLRFLRTGTGVGQPTAILNAPCTIAINRTKASDVLYEDLVAMVARLNPGSFQKSVWVAHVSTIPKLLQLTVRVSNAAGTDYVGGSWVPVLKEDGKGGYSVLTRPLIFTEKAETLGSKGDIGLYDFSQYVVGVRREMRFQTTIAELFSTDQVSGRMTHRVEGLPLWNEPLTLSDGTTTVSPFVVLDVPA